MEATKWKNRSAAVIKRRKRGVLRLACVCFDRVCECDAVCLGVKEPSETRKTNNGW